MILSQGRKTVIIRRISPLVFLACVACTGQQLAPPAQVDPKAIQLVNEQLAMITSDPATTWLVGDYAVRTACHAYLNGAASQQSNMSLAGTAIGVAGAGLSIVNPLAGVASSLVQTLISAYSNSGPVPTTADAILIENYLDTYEVGVALAPPMSQALAMSEVDDEWYHCSPGGIAVMAMQAKTTAQLSVIGPTAALSARAVRAAVPTRPVVTINGH
jgi:hypothetical protein